MKNKIAARDLFYTQGLPSYDDSKGAKLKRFTKKIVFPCLRLVYGDRVFLDVVKNCTIFSRNNGE